MSFSLPKLPYERKDLEPHISEETLNYHYGKHHQAYVNKLNDLVQGTDHEKQSLEEIIKGSSGGIFNNAAQIWNHTFYWNSLSPKGGGAPQGKIAQKINETFGSFESFQKQFTEDCKGLFGSGWVWVVLSGDKLEILKMPNAGCPLTEGKTPLLTCDVWEHAYYIDYRNSRPNYVDAFWKLINWEFANQNLG